MADYVPHYEDGPFPSTASAPVVGGQVLVVTAPNTVGPSAGASSAVVGVAAFDAASGARVTVVPIARDYVHRLTASGAVTAGDQVVSAVAGKVSTLPATGTSTAADINSSRQVIGVALTSAIDGASVEVLGR